MPYGIIITFGTKALTIQTNDKKQYYAPFKNLDKCFLEIINEINLIRLPVKFNINENLFSGYSNGCKRYYAENIIIELII